jgi:hypothetical protein
MDVDTINAEIVTVIKDSAVPCIDLKESLLRRLERRRARL